MPTRRRRTMRPLPNWRNSTMTAVPHARCLSRNKEALADGLQALAVGKGAIEFRQVSRIRQFVALQYRALGDPKQAITAFDSIVREGNQPTLRGTMINALANIAGTLVSMGDVTQATTYAGRIEALVQEARGSPNPNWRRSYSIYGHSWESDAEAVRGMVFEARGQYAEAEAAYRRDEAFRRAAVKDSPKYDYPPPPEQMMLAADRTLLWVARNETKQGRLSEAEADARRALLGVLKQQGKYSPVGSFVHRRAGRHPGGAGPLPGGRKACARRARRATHARHRR